MSEEVTPPAGYRFATDADMDCLPAGALVIDPRDPLDVWAGSSMIGGSITADLSPPLAYAVPITPQPVAASADSKAAVAPPEGYRLATEAELDCLPRGALFWVPEKGWAVSLCCGYPVPAHSRDIPYAVPTDSLFDDAPDDWATRSNKCVHFSGTIPIRPASADPKGEAGKATDVQVGGSHYKGLAIQPAEYCQRNRLLYCEANVVKYVTRHREKNGREDIEKAIHYLQLLLEIEYPNL